MPTKKTPTQLDNALELAALLAQVMNRLDRLEAWQRSTDTDAGYLSTQQHELGREVDSLRKAITTSGCSVRCDQLEADVRVALEQSAAALEQSTRLLIRLSKPWWRFWR